MRRAFTLLELIVVIAIIGMLAVIVLSFTSGSRARAQNSNAKSDVSVIGKAIEAVKAKAESEYHYNSGTVETPYASETTRINGRSTSQTCTALINQDCKSANWNDYFNVPSLRYDIRITKTPSVNHTYVYATNAPSAAIIPQRGSVAYCIGTSVYSTSFAQDGGFYIANGSSVQLPNSAQEPTYSNSLNPCS